MARRRDGLFVCLAREHLLELQHGVGFSLHGQFLEGLFSPVLYIVWDRLYIGKAWLHRGLNCDQPLFCD